MVLQASGAISLADIQTEFGGTNPIGMNEYYTGGTYVDSTATTIPTSGAINLNHFFGKSKIYRIVASSTYYTLMTRYNSAFTIVQTGSDPDVQLQLASSSVGSSVTHSYASNNLASYNTVTIEFEVYIDSSALADAIFFYMGLTSAPTNAFYESSFFNSPGYQLNMEVYAANGTYVKGIHLIKNNTTTVTASYPTTTHISSTWLPIKIIYTKSATNTFQVFYNGPNILNYSASDYATFVANAGPYWGFGARTGGQKGSMYIRRVNVTAT
jgi:hypothetical protein